MLTKLLSSDSHIQEPPSLWRDRLAVDLRDRGPNVVEEESGDFWWVDGLRMCSFVGGTQVGKRFEAPSELVTIGRFRDVREATYVAAGYVEDNLGDSVAGSVLYPTVGLLFFGVKDSRLFTAICQAYNDWIAEFATYNPDRLKGIAMINLDDIDEAIQEIMRTKQMGLAGVLLPSYPYPGPTYDSPDYDPLWAVVQDLELPVSFHLGTNRSGLATPGQFQEMKESTLVTSDYWIRQTLADIIFGCVFDRFPRLRVGSVENGLGWAPHFLDRMDNLYTERPRHEGWRRFRDPGLLPSEVYRQHVFMSFQDDRRGVAERAVLGVDRLMWGSDYPHTESTFPHSATVLDGIFDSLGVASSERLAISYDNTRKLYGFDEAKIALGV